MAETNGDREHEMKESSCTGGQVTWNKQGKMSNWGEIKQGKGEQVTYNQDDTMLYKGL